MITIDFENLLLEEKQKELLIALVEAARNQPIERREKFLFIRSAGGTGIYGLDDYPDPYIGDVEELGRSRLLNTSRTRKGTLQFDVSQLGYRYYEYMMQSSGEATERIEDNIQHYLDSRSFENRHPTAYAKWKQAEELLWGSDSQKQHTTVGHHCREAMQYFATSLVENFQPPDVEQDITKTVKRVEAVLKQTAEQLSYSVAAILEAMFQYWRTLNDLAQRQEHGAQREGETLTWEDSRRLVFQTAIVLFEIDRTLQDLK